MECDKYYLDIVLGGMLLISEVLPFIKNKESCNGIVNTILCAFLKCRDDIEEEEDIGTQV
tara:strand:- start:4884 stop:5063 length:180 start_codon:yes stop_codon:yes gene_type:complete